MPTTGSFLIYVERKLGKFPRFLVYVILEWLIIFLLFVDGFLTFISNAFAKFFELQTPCLLCTRIDHVLLNRESNFYYNDSICEDHKKDISSLAYCHVHKRLSDIRNMCEGCLLSFATEKDSDTDCDKYKSFVGVLHKDVDGFVEDDRKLLMKPLKKDDIIELSGEMSGVPKCSCCGEVMKMKSNNTKFKRNLSMNVVPTPSPRVSFLSSKLDEGRNLELPHVRYTELKFVSDTDSEIPEEELAPVVYNQGKEDVKTVTMPLLPDSEDINDDVMRTPSFARGNRFFGIPLSDSAQASPRWGPRFNRKLSIDKTEFSFDPNDLTSLNELDGDILSRLKRQVRVDRKSLIELYMELDEERSASAVAANNAMAMITRLQAEKAAVQMEALQYQRMMEEQAEYDQEALQVMKDMLLKGDEQIKGLESELETYREKYGQIKKVGSEICEADVDDDYQDMKSQSYPSDCGNLDQSENERPYDRSMEHGSGNLAHLDFEGERSFLLGLLTDIEKKIHEKGSNSLESIDTIKPEEENKGNENKATLTREVSLIRDRLRAVEADSGFLKHAAMTLQRGGEGAKLLMEIAQHLRSLRRVKPTTDNHEDA